MHAPVELTDDELVIQAAQGDGRAFEAIFNRNHARIYGLCYRFLGSHHDTEDVVQEVFIKAARALPRFHRRSSLQTWLYRIACGTACDWVRRKRRGGQPVQFDEALHGTSPVGAETSGDQDHVALFSALQRLSMEQRQAVLLVYSEDMSHAEAAQVLGCAETTISWRIFVARRQLKKLMTQGSLKKDFDD